MPSEAWLKTVFSGGYSSGDITADVPDAQRQAEEAKIGGSYKEMIAKGAVPYVTPTSRILELGPGAGSWTRALLDLVPEGEVHTLDFVDVLPFINPYDYAGHLQCHRIYNIDYGFLPDDFFDLFFSVGVLCHNAEANRFEILKQALPKVKPGGYAVHHHGDWDKLETFTWERGMVPREFKDMPDGEIWWPRNSTKMMCETAERAGWKVVIPDLGIFGRDGAIVLQKVLVRASDTGSTKAN